jgi:hypothetical protein
MMHINLPYQQAEGSSCEQWKNQQNGTSNIAEVCWSIFCEGNNNILDKIKIVTGTDPGINDFKQCKQCSHSALASFKVTSDLKQGVRTATLDFSSSTQVLQEVATMEWEQYWLVCEAQLVVTQQFWLQTEGLGGVGHCFAWHVWVSLDLCQFNLKTEELVHSERVQCDIWDITAYFLTTMKDK